MVVPNPTPIVHITDVRNLAAIVASGLCCCSTLRKNGTAYADIANSEIQDRRATCLVPITPGGTLHDYVPFYFHPRSPMLYKICRDRSRYPQGQASIVQLVSTAQVASVACPFVFTDGHAIMSLSEFYADLATLDQIDWPLMREKYWNDTQADPDRKRRRQAEFLVYQRFPWELVTEVAVLNRQVEAEVVQIVTSAAHRPPVQVRPNWYY